MATIAEGAQAAPVELRILTHDGALLQDRHDREAGPSTEHLRPIYEAMVRTRLLDQELGRLSEQGRIGFYATAPGEEAASVAAAAALQPNDWVFVGRRELGVALWRGLSPQRVLDGAFGNASDGAKGRALPGLVGSREARVVASSGLPGNHLIHATGCGWAARSSGDPIVAAAWFADSAAESAEFHTALNFAGVFRVPVVFLGRSRGPKGALAARAVAYGIESVLCDGGDALAVLAATGRARERALAGQGPTLIELALGEHTDESDPLRRVRRFLERQNAWTDEAQRALDEQTTAAVTAAVAHAGQAPPPPAASLFDDTFARAPWHLAEQRAALANLPGDR
ncbi:MAG: hypothetical protein EOO75_03790 [Myxococcales bacterium]|nr:MAG: hypothetical protein EOO75_03790 [Myxococcales bacterium]